MPQKEDSSKKGAVKNLGEMFEAFGDAVSRIFDDPDLKDKAREFGRSAVEAMETFNNRFRDDDVKEKFRDAGRAAQDFGKSVEDYFKPGKD